MSDTTIQMEESASSTVAETTLILLHGATGNQQMWNAVRRSLDPCFKVLTPDFPGHGTRRGEPFTLDGAIATVVESAREVFPSPVVLVGDSLGGYAAMASASLLPPEQLTGLVLGGCSANVTGKESIPFLVKAVTFKILIAIFGEPRLIRQNVQVLVKLGMKESDVHAVIDAGLNLSAFEKVVYALRGIDFREKLSHIRQAVLIVNGSRDGPMINQEPSFLAALPQGRHLRFGDCEHGVSMLRSAEFAEAVNDFVARIHWPICGPSNRLVLQIDGRES
jgi:pimeloyl-ACP methyl ester carboxylesterase